MSFPGLVSPPMSSSAPPSDVIHQLAAAIQGLQSGGLQGGHAHQHKSFSSIKSILPDLNKNTFNSTTNPDGLEAWIQQTGSIVASVSEAGRELEELLDSSTKRNVGRETAHVITTVPMALQGDDMQDGPAPDAFRIASPHKSYSSTASPHPQDECLRITKYCELSDEAKDLDKVLYTTILSIVIGPVRDTINSLPGPSPGIGNRRTYVQAIKVLYDQLAQNSSSLKHIAVKNLLSFSYDGNPTNMSITFLKLLSDLSHRDVGMEDIIMEAFIRGFEGKSKTAQTEVAKMINQRMGRDEQGKKKSVNVHEVVTDLAALLSTMGEGQKSVTFAQHDGFKGNCSNCGTKGHKWSECTAPKKVKAQNGQQCTYCLKDNHTRSECLQIAWGRPPHADSSNKTLVNLDKERFGTERRGGNPKAAQKSVSFAMAARTSADEEISTEALRPTQHTVSMVRSTVEPPTVTYATSYVGTCASAGMEEAVAAFAYSANGDEAREAYNNLPSEWKASRDAEVRDQAFVANKCLADKRRGAPTPMLLFHAPAEATRVAACLPDKEDFSRPLHDPRLDNPQEPNVGWCSVVRLVAKDATAEQHAKLARVGNQVLQEFNSGDKAFSTTTHTQCGGTKGAALFAEALSPCTKLEQGLHAANSDCCMDEGSGSTPSTPTSDPELPPSHLSADTLHATTHPLFDPQAMVLMVTTSAPAVPKDEGRVVLSLCDGIGAGAAAQRQAGFAVGKYIAVEIQAEVRQIATNQNPSIQHGLNGKHDVLQITEDDIKGIQRLDDFLVGAPCNDFSTNRLMKDRPGWNGPPGVPGVDPRLGLEGKTGQVFKHVLKIFEWVRKHHPMSTWMVENVVFRNMPEHWARVNKVLGQPVEVCSSVMSYTKRPRAFWIGNGDGPIQLSKDWNSGYSPMDGDECMDRGRSIEKYHVGDRLLTRTIGASWIGDGDKPKASSSKRVFVNDVEDPKDDQLRPNEAESLMGFPQGFTECPGINAKTRLCAIGNSFDMNIVVPLLESREPAQDHASSGRCLITKPKSQSYKIIDSGSSKHLDRQVDVDNPDETTCLVGAEGSTFWTQGSGGYQLELTDLDSDQQFAENIGNVGKCDSISHDILSVGLLVQAGWEIHLQSTTDLVAITPGGRRVQLEFTDDNILVFPVPPSGITSTADRPPDKGTVATGRDRGGAARRGTVTWDELHRTLNHVSADRIKRTLAATKGYDMPQSAPPTIPCTTCLETKAQRKGLGHGVSFVMTDELAAMGAEEASTFYRVQDMIEHDPVLCLRYPHGVGVKVAPKLKDVESDTKSGGVWQDDWDSDDEQSDYESDDEQSDYDDVNNPFSVLRCMMVVDDYSDYSGSDTSTEEFEEELDGTEQEGDALVAHLHDSLAADVFTEPADEFTEVADELYVPPNAEATVAKSAIEHLPRFNLDELQPFQVMFVDNKKFDTVQRGGFIEALVFYDVKSSTKDMVPLFAKLHNGRGFRDLMALYGVAKLPYKCTIYTDGCGSMAHVREVALSLGIDHQYIPPHEQSLNEAETVIKLMWDSGRTLLQKSNLPANLMAMAVKHSCYVDFRMAVSARRGITTPHTIVAGHAPNIGHLMPFGSKVWVTSPKAKRMALKAKGDYNSHAELGRLVGYSHMLGTTPQVLLSDNRLVSSINVRYEEYEAAADVIATEVVPPSQGTLLLERANNGDDQIISYESKSKKQSTTSGTTLDIESADQEGELDSVDVADAFLQSPPYVPLANRHGEAAEGLSEAEGLFGDCHIQLENQDIVSDQQAEQYQHCDPGKRQSVTTETYQPHSTGMEKNLHRASFCAELSNVNVLNETAQVEKIDNMFKVLTAQTKGSDSTVALEVAAELASSAQKDMSWKKALASPQRDLVLKALHNEVDSLCKTILTEVKPDDVDFATAKEQAISGRFLLDIKRSGKYKARGVKQGFKEDKSTADGPGFSYYSTVAKLSTVRGALLRSNRRNRRIAIKDISTAFLQSDGYENGKVKYIVFRDPETNKLRYFSQSGPIYGEASAPVRWENTVAPFLENVLGFKRGQNERCCFNHEQRDLLVVLYVDDILADGDPEQIQWVFDQLDERFECKDAEHLTTDAIIDYLGMEISMTDDHLYICMETYIVNALEILGLDKERSVTTPIDEPIDGMSSPLTPAERHYFLKSLGMAGWLCNTARPDLSYAHSRIAQHSASPTVSALAAVKRLFRYLIGTKDLSIRIPLHVHINVDLPTVSTHTPQPWGFFCDSDFAGNAEEQNKRRSQNGMIALVSGAPVYWASKVSSVCFAHPDIGEAHADVSSGAAEVYAAGNACHELTYLSYIIDEMGMDFPKPIHLQMDNAACQTFCEGPAFKSRLKHIDARQEWVRMLRNKSILIACHVPTADNLADIFTKILGPEIFQRVRDRIMHRRILLV